MFCSHPPSSRPPPHIHPSPAAAPPNITPTPIHPPTHTPAHPQTPSPCPAAQVGKVDAILTDPHLHTGIKICILINVIVAKLDYAGQVWEGNAKFVKQPGTAQMTAAAKNILGCSSTTSNTALRAELGTYPLKTNGDVRTVEMAI